MNNINNTERFKVFDGNGVYLGDGVIENVLTDNSEAKNIKACVIRFDNGELKRLNVSDCEIIRTDDDYYDLKSKQRAKEFKYGFYFITITVIVVGFIYLLISIF